MKITVALSWTAIYGSMLQMDVSATKVAYKAVTGLQRQSEGAKIVPLQLYIIGETIVLK